MKKTENVLKELYIYLHQNFKPGEDTSAVKSRAILWMSEHAHDYDFDNITYEGTDRIIGYGLSYMKEHGYYEETILLLKGKLIYLKGLDKVHFSKDYTIAMTLCEARKVSTNITPVDLPELLDEAAVYKREVNTDYLLPRTDETCLSLAYGKRVASSMLNTINKVMTKKDNTKQPTGYIVLLRVGKQVKPSRTFFVDTEQDAIELIKDICRIKAVEELNMVGELEYDYAIPNTGGKIVQHFKIVKEP